LAVVGPEASARLAVAGQLARALAPEAGLYLVELGKAIGQGTLREELAEAVRGSVLTGAVVAITGFDDLEHPEAAIEATHRAFDALPVPRVWLTRQAEPSSLRVSPAQLVSMGYPSRAQRLETWRLWLGDRPPELALQLAGGFLLSEAQIALAVEEATARSESREPSEEALILAARSQAATGLGTLARPEETKVELEQVVLGAETRTLLDELLAYAQHRDALVAEWGFGDTLSYGLGVTALFVGPPGTGKTLAAGAIAKALGKELYRVDLAQLVSKYIGETEKHLAEVFDAAQQGEVMLLFDETDSLFGKRTEVKSSVDRYANLEVNYLLQRIERFEGVVVLTTNHEKGIDEAFARRIRFRIEFDAPDAEARRRLWRALLPAQVPLAPEVDLDLLAERYELSGGHIKEVALRAASLAKAAGTAVQQQQLLRSAEAEYRKLGKLSLVQRTPRFEDKR
jgi:SpoVK/Ycf46/Vps4 family AAA+-type ATPase